MAFTGPPGTEVLQLLPNGTQPVIPAGYVDAESLDVVHTESYGPDTMVPHRFAPVCWAKLVQVKGTSEFFQGNAMLYCHERISNAGHRRLVVIECPSTPYAEQLPQQLTFYVWSPIGFWNDGFVSSGGGLRFSFAGYMQEGPSSFEAGRSDLNDDSHFMIAYRWLDGMIGVIDGWLNDDDTVKLVDRPGPGDVASAQRRFLQNH